MQIPLTTGDFLIRALRTRPDDVALTDVPGELGSPTWRELASRVATIVAGLDAAGLERGSRIAVVSPNRGRFLELLYAVPSSGRVLVPVNPRLGAREIEHIVVDSGAKVVFVDPAVDALSDSLPARVIPLGPRSDAFLGLGRPIEATEESLRFRQDENATATLNYTSGTTSAPKGVALTHRNIWLSATTLGLHIGLRESDVYLHTLPLFHVNGWEMPYITAGLGVHNVMIGAIRGGAILDLIRDHGVTVLCCAPTVLSTVLAALPDRTDADIPGAGIPGAGRLRVVCAGAPPPSTLIERVETELGWEFIQVFGLTETAPMATINRVPAEAGHGPRRRAEILGRQGYPFLGTDIAVDPDGQVLVRSNHVMAGYHHRPEESARVLADDWFRTGDAGFIDDDGRLRVTDRIKDVIVTGGENVSSIEVEECLTAHPAVRDVAVTSRPDITWGKRSPPSSSANRADRSARRS
ncbi:class I adenylate-forming enzyme family protein [Millisia brevis]|uniref:class I adenylate-forming enzyme family protein n=1 Tax=Millisia brevis TaxID=264148 RepID=UPI000B298FBF